MPARVSVVGYDDIFGADFCSPPLTTVAGPVDEAGRALVDVLLAGGSRLPVITLPTHLRVGLHRAAAAGRTVTRRPPVLRPTSIGETVPDPREEPT